MADENDSKRALAVTSAIGIAGLIVAIIFGIVNHLDNVDTRRAGNTSPAAAPNPPQFQDSPSYPSDRIQSSSPSASTSTSTPSITAIESGSNLPSRVVLLDSCDSPIYAIQPLYNCSTPTGSNTIGGTSFPVTVRGIGENHGPQKPFLRIELAGRFTTVSMILGIPDYSDYRCEARFTIFGDTRPLGQFLYNPSNTFSKVSLNVTAVRQLQYELTFTSQLQDTSGPTCYGAVGAVYGSEVSP